jgi:hypothetical protein
VRVSLRACVRAWLPCTRALMQVFEYLGEQYVNGPSEPDPAPADAPAAPKAAAAVAPPAVAAPASSDAGKGAAPAPSPSKASGGAAMGGPADFGNAGNIPSVSVYAGWGVAEVRSRVGWEEGVALVWMKGWPWCGWSR